jgi:hypothetical protein
MADFLLWHEAPTDKHRRHGNAALETSLAVHAGPVAAAVEPVAQPNARSRQVARCITAHVAGPRQWTTATPMPRPMPIAISSGSESTASPTSGSHRHPRAPVSIKCEIRKQTPASQRTTIYLAILARARRLRARPPIRTTATLRGPPCWRARVDRLVRPGQLRLAARWPSTPAQHAGRLVSVARPRPPRWRCHPHRAHCASTRYAGPLCPGQRPARRPPSWPARDTKGLVSPNLLSSPPPSVPSNFLHLLLSSSARLFSLSRPLTSSALSLRSSARPQPSFISASLALLPALAVCGALDRSVVSVRGRLPGWSSGPSTHQLARFWILAVTLRLLPLVLESVCRIVSAHSLLGE